jgi:uncharacterized protein (TIGR02147 family)
MLTIPLQKQLFSAKSYRQFIAVMIKENSSTRGYKTRLAQCAGCQPAYFSQMLGERVELTPEQAERLCHLWDLDQWEGEYFFELVNLARAGTPTLRNRIQLKLTQIKSAWLAKNQSFEKPSLQGPDRTTVYYSHWLHSAVHILISVPALRTPEALAKHLNITKENALAVLRELGQVGLATEQDGQWSLTQAHIHATQKDFFAEVHHKNWRQQAIELRKSNRQTAIRYTSVHSLSQADFLKIRNLIEQLIKDTRQTIAASPEEMAACLVMDYFSV